MNRLTEYPEKTKEKTVVEHERGRKTERKKERKKLLLRQSSALLEFVSSAAGWRRTLYRRVPLGA